MKRLYEMEVGESGQVGLSALYTLHNSSQNPELWLDTKEYLQRRSRRHEERFISTLVIRTEDSYSLPSVDSENQVLVLRRYTGRWGNKTEEKRKNDVQIGYIKAATDGNSVPNFYPGLTQDLAQEKERFLDLLYQHKIIEQDEETDRETRGLINMLSGRDITEEEFVALINDETLTIGYLIE